MSIVPRYPIADTFKRHSHEEQYGEFQVHIEGNCAESHPFTAEEHQECVLENINRVDGRMAHLTVAKAIQAEQILRQATYDAVARALQVGLGLVLKAIAA